MTPLLIKSYEASAAIGGNRIVAFSDVAASAKIAVAASAIVPAIGVSDAMGADAGGMCDVVLAGVVPVVAGGVVTAGAPLMSDAAGAAIVATALAATTRRIIGFALQPGVAGDLIHICLSQSLLDRA